ARRRSSATSSPSGCSVYPDDGGPMNELSPEDIERLQTPTWEQAKAAIRAGDSDAAVELIDRAVGQWRSLQEYSINWVTALLSFIGREMGEAAVEDALRDTGERF